MLSSPNQWFVKTDFGALLGPMPDDALAEMARTGALLNGDRVREGADGDWQLARDLPGLFDENSLTLSPLTSQASDQLLREMPDGSLDTVNALDLNRLHEPSPLREPPSPQKPFATQTDLSRTLTKPETTVAAADSEALDFELDVPLVHPPSSAESPPVNPEVPAKNAPVSLVKSDAAPRERSPSSQSSSFEESRSADEPVQLPRLSRQTEFARAARVRRFSVAESFFSRRDFRQRLLPVAIIAGVFMLLVSAWWFWPRQRSDIFAHFSAIYEELQQRRGSTDDQSGWDEFVTRAKTQMDKDVPWLETKAEPGDREKSLLLYAGRDLQELLDIPRNAKYAHQARLDVFLDQLQDIYVPPKSL